MSTSADKHCTECAFDWSISFTAAVETVIRAPDRYAGAFVAAPVDSIQVAPGVWSPRQYLWHLVDVLRYGTERLQTLKLDPDAGAMAWDANAAMDLRARSRHSLAVGLEELRSVSRDWAMAALSAPDHVTTVHPDFGPMDWLLMVRRNAHEVVHHEYDVRRGLAVP